MVKYFYEIKFYGLYLDLSFDILCSIANAVVPNQLVMETMPLPKCIQILNILIGKQLQNETFVSISSQQIDHTKEYSTY